MIRSMLGNKDEKRQGIKRTETLKTLCNFMKNVSLEWDVEESQKLAQWYITSYFKDLEENDNVPLQEKYNSTLLHTLSLWSDVHCLCPLIREFKSKTFNLADDKTLELVLPQLLISIQSLKDHVLIDKLIERLGSKEKSAISMFWHIVVEIERQRQPLTKDPLKHLDDYYEHLAYKMMKNLESSKEGTSIKYILERQGYLVERLVGISGQIRQCRKNISEKKRMLKQILNESPDLLLFDPIPLPVSTSSRVIGIIPDKCSVFQSQLNPLLLTFLATDGKTKKCIFKSGDDLRQDALISRILTIICSILNNNGISCKNIITYDVIPTGCYHGFVEYVDNSQSLDEILQKSEGLSSILRGDNGKLDEGKMAKFVESTAYYTVITYILCVGDRHLDNILVTTDGKFFHIDYGFLGREPKPFAPTVKLCPEIIEVMGGKYSGYYATFIRRCISCYVVLRKNAHVILDAMELMCDADISDINNGTIAKLRQRFCLETSDQDAIELLRMNIERGFETILPQMLDSFHHTWKVVQNGIPKETHDMTLDEWLEVDIEDI